MSFTLRSGTYQSVFWPTLDEVLTNTAPPPYTLSTFISYLSQNHCLETFEFTLEAKRYRETYDSFVDRTLKSTAITEASKSQHLRMLFQFFLTMYVLPGAPREVNLSVDVRDALLRHKDMSTPPLPEVLDPAVKSVHNLMEDSIFVSFLNSCSTFLSGEPALEAPNRNDIRLCGSDINSDNYPTNPVRWRAKRPPLNPLRWTWSHSP